METIIEKSGLNALEDGQLYHSAQETCDFFVPGLGHAVIGDRHKGDIELSIGCGM